MFIHLLKNHLILNLPANKYVHDVLELNETLSIASQPAVKPTFLLYFSRSLFPYLAQAKKWKVKKRKLTSECN